VAKAFVGSNPTPRTRIRASYTDGLVCLENSERIRVAVRGSRRSLEASLGNGSATGLSVREKEDPRKPRRGVMQSGCGGVRYGHVHARARGHRLWGPRGSRMLQLDHLRLSSLPSN